MAPEDLSITRLIRVAVNASPGWFLRWSMTSWRRAPGARRSLSLGAVTSCRVAARAWSHSVRRRGVRIPGRRHRPVRARRPAAGCQRPGPFPRRARRGSPSGCPRRGLLVLGVAAGVRVCECRWWSGVGLRVVAAVRGRVRGGARQRSGCAGRRRAPPVRRARPCSSRVTRALLVVERPRPEARRVRRPWWAGASGQFWCRRWRALRSGR